MPNTVKTPPPEPSTGKYDGETVRKVIFVWETYLKVTGVKNESTQALFVKRRLSDTPHT